MYTCEAHVEWIYANVVENIYLWTVMQTLKRVCTCLTIQLLNDLHRFSLLVSVEIRIA